MEMQKVLNYPEKTGETLINDMSCPHCKALEVFDVDNPREYWLMTELFVYLHDGDVCNYSKDRYSTKRLAVKVKAEAESERGEPLRVYGCRSCGGWHLTSAVSDVDFQP